VRHELTCSACGAPLHDMKMMPRRAKTPIKASAPAASRRTTSAKKHYHESDQAPRSYKRQKPKKRRKSLGKKVFEELWDVVEDIFD